MRFFRWLLAPRRRALKLLGAALGTIVLIYGGLSAVSWMRSPENRPILQWMRGDSAERESLVTVQRDACSGAPFILPADGFIGLLYGDTRGPYSTSSPHQGIDIFSSTDPGITPVYAAYDGYVTREPGWRSTVIMRVPDDPLNPGTQIWLYYTHMADRSGNDYIEPQFAPGTVEKYVPQGTLLGYTGEYNGDSLRTVWVHLHFSIVRDDGSGRYLNELAFENTIDPSPYLGLKVNYSCAANSEPDIACTPDPSCA